MALIGFLLSFLIGKYLMPGPANTHTFSFSSLSWASVIAFLQALIAAYTASQNGATPAAADASLLQVTFKK